MILKTILTEIPPVACTRILDLSLSIGGVALHMEQTDTFVCKFI